MKKIEKEKIPKDVLARSPLMEEGWMGLYRRMGEDECAPLWNTQCGDRLTEQDLSFVRKYAVKLETGRNPFGRTPDPRIIEWIAYTSKHSDFFEDRLHGIDPGRDFFAIKPMERSDLQASLHLLLPRDADLGGLLINPTSGTTGQPIPCPNHPAAVGCYDPLINLALRKNGLTKHIEAGEVAAVQLCAQNKTITYYTVHSYYCGAGFAKINIEPSEWRKPDDPVKYIERLSPVFLSGDPYSYLRAMDLGVRYRPKALLSTASALEPEARVLFESHYGCKVTDLYSLNETGPVAYSCPINPDRFHVLPHDIFVEVLKEDGTPCAEGELGAIAVTGGRNPYMPLLRYVTGDSGAMDYSECECGDSMPSLVSLAARKMQVFRKPGGGMINSLDIARIIRMYPVLEFRFVQEADFSCTLFFEPAGRISASQSLSLEAEISSLFGGRVSISIEKTTFGRAKTIPFECKAGG